MRKEDLTGQRFNRLVAVSRADGQKWLFQCDCGTQKEINSPAVKAGRTKSCGCYNLDNLSRRRNVGEISVFIDYRGTEMTIEDWSEKTGINQNTLRRRYSMGWSAERMLTTPVRGYVKHDRKN